MIRNRIALIAGCACLLAVLLAAVPSQAAVLLTNGNSTTTIDQSSSAGQMNWFVDGSNELAQQWFWVSINGAAPVAINTLSAATIVSQSSNAVTFSYTGSGITVQTTFTLNGGAAGSGTSDMPISIAVTNNSTTSTVNVNIFEYANFDLNASAGNDLLNIVQNTPSGFIQQTEGATSITETNTIDAFNQWQGGSPASVLGPGAGSVLSGSLGDSPALNTQIGPADEAWAVEWIRASIAINGQVGSTVSVSKNEHLSGALPGLSVPEASSIAVWGLLGLTFGGVAIGRRRATQPA
jgi:hypothetical protein